MRTVLKVKKITKIYSKGQKPSLSKVSFDVAEGEFIGIMGHLALGKQLYLTYFLLLIKQQAEKYISMV